MESSRIGCVLLRKASLILSVCSAIVLLSSPAFSQVNLGRILGTVRDQTGGVMADAKVTVTDQERGVSRNLTTDAAGAFAAPA